MPQELKGIFTPNIVPYDAAGRINEEELRRIIRWLEIYNSAQNGDWDTAKQAQFKLLDLFALMINAPNFPEGFRAGYQLRGFETGNARFPLSEEERVLMDDIRSRITCVLAECGFSEAAHACVHTTANGLAPAPDDMRVKVEAIVRDVMQSMQQPSR